MLISNRNCCGTIKLQDIRIFNWNPECCKPFRSLRKVLIPELQSIYLDNSGKKTPFRKRVWCVLKFRICMHFTRLSIFQWNNPAVVIVVNKFDASLFSRIVQKQGTRGNSMRDRSIFGALWLDTQVLHQQKNDQWAIRTQIISRSNSEVFVSRRKDNSSRNFETNGCCVCFFLPITSLRFFPYEHWRKGRNLKIRTQDIFSQRDLKKERERFRNFSKMSKTSQTFERSWVD